MKRLLIFVLVILAFIVAMWFGYVGWTDTNLEFVLKREVPNFISGLLAIISNVFGLIFNIVVSLMR